MIETRLHTIPEAAAFLRVSRSQVYVLARRGVLPTRKLGNKSLIARADIDRLVDGLPTAQVRAA